MTNEHQLVGYQSWLEDFCHILLKYVSKATLLQIHQIRFSLTSMHIKWRVRAKYALNLTENSDYLLKHY